MISVVLITQKSIFIPLGKKGRRAYSKASERHKEQRELKRKEKEAQREAEAAEEERGTGGNRNVTFEDVKEKFEKKDFNFDLSAATEVPETEKVKKSKTDKKSRADKPSVEDITEEIILPWQDEESIPVNHMEPIESVNTERRNSFIVPEGDLRPIDIDIEDDFGVMEEPESDGKSGEMSEKIHEGASTAARGNTSATATHVPSASAAARAAAKAETVKASAPSAAEKQATAEDIEAALEHKPEYVFPPLSLLVRGERNNGGNTDEQLRQTAAKLKSTLESFGVKVQITNVSCGPSVTRYELQPEQGVKVSKDCQSVR